MSNILCHIAGPSGCGKTTLMNKLKEKFPQFVYKDLDDFDDDVLAKIIKKGEDTSLHKQMMSNEEFDKFFDKKQKLFQSFVESAKRPVVLVGIHTELPRKFEFYTPNKFLLNCTAEGSAVQAIIRHKNSNSTHSNHFVGANDISDLWKRKNQAQRDILWLCRNGYVIKANQEIEDFLRHAAYEGKLKNEKKRLSIEDKEEPKLPSYIQNLDSTPVLQRIAHPFSPNSLQELPLGRIANDFRYAAKVKDGADFPEILRTSPLGQSGIIRRELPSGEKDLTFKPTDLDLASFADYAGAIIYNALHKMGRHKKSSSDIHMDLLHRIEEETDPDTYPAELEKLNEARMHTLFDDLALQREPRDGFSHIVDLHARNIANLARNTYLNYLTSHPTASQTFLNFLEANKEHEDSNNKLGKIYMDKLRSMLRGEHLKGE